MDTLMPHSSSLDVERNPVGAPGGLLAVEAGPDRWLLALSDAGEVLPVPDVQTMPLTKSWYLGLVNVRGNLYGVTE